MIKLVLVLFQSLFCAGVFAQDKVSDDKDVATQRPSMFPELDMASTLCMKECPLEISHFMGIRVLCGNHDRVEYDKSCGNTAIAIAEYCNCSKTDCARFAVACTTDRNTCHVAMLAQGLTAQQCDCSGRTCEQPGLEMSSSTCVMRRDVRTQVCSLDSFGTRNDGKAFHTSCDIDHACNSQQVETGVMNKQPMSMRKPSEPK